MTHLIFRITLYDRHGNAIGIYNSIRSYTVHKTSGKIFFSKKFLYKYCGIQCPINLLYFVKYNKIQVGRIHSWIFYNMGNHPRLHKPSFFFQISLLIQEVSLKISSWHFLGAFPGTVQIQLWFITISVNMKMKTQVAQLKTRINQPQDQL